MAQEKEDEGLNNCNVLEMKRSFKSQGEWGALVFATSSISSSSYYKPSQNYHHHHHLS